MSKKKSETNIERIREQAAEATHAWLAATEASEAATKHFLTVAPAGSGSRDNRDGVNRRDAEIAHLEAKDGAVLARDAASVDVDALEIATGDPLAITRDVKHLAADLTGLLAEEARVSAELDEARKRIQLRISEAEKAQAELAARRTAEGKPPPASIPRAVAPFSGLVTPKALLTALEKRLETGLVAAKPTSEHRIRQLRAEVTELLAAIERKHREKEEEKARIADHDRRKEAERKQEQKRAAEEHAHALAKRDAEKAEQQALANAARARIAG